MLKLIPILSRSLCGVAMIACAAIALCVPAHAADERSWLDPKLRAAARPEGTVVVYSAINEQEALPSWQVFEDATGLKVEYVRGSDAQPEGLSAPSQGNAQTTRDGDLFVGWGALPYFSEFSPSGELVFNAQFPAGVNTYRAYLLPWHPYHPGGSPPRNQ